MSPGGLIFIYEILLRLHPQICGIMLQGDDNVTIEDLKKMDKQLRKISDPFGNGFPKCRKLFEDWAKEYDLPVHVIGHEYTAWKWKKK